MALNRLPKKEENEESATCYNAPFYNVIVTFVALSSPFYLLTHTTLTTARVRKSRNAVCI
jgi:hypothetical protein